MTIRNITSGLLLLALSIAPTHAIVYSLRTGYTVDSIKKIIKAKKALTEPVSYNGYDTTLQVDVTQMQMNDILLMVKPALKNFKSTSGQRSLIIDIPQDGKITRLFILNARPGSKTVIFQLQIPKDRLIKDAGRFWPSSVPRPANVQMDQVMQLKKSKSFYGKFNTRMQAAELHRNYSQLLINSGWRKVTGDSVGGVYMDAKDGRMLVFAANDGNDKTHASVYVSRTR